MDYWIRRSRLGIVLAALAALALLGAACTDDEGNGDGTDATTEPTAADTATEAPDGTATEEPTEEATEAAGALPGEGVEVRPARATWNTGYFQEAVYSAALEELGYDVQDHQELDNPIFYQSVANGDVHFWANGWFPLHNQYSDTFEEGAEVAGTVARAGALEGYLVNQSAVDELGVTSLGDFTQDEVKQAFDHNGNGLADLYGCPPGWGCNTVIEYHLEDLGLTDHVEHLTGGYSTNMADAVARYEAGENILFYTWTPNWTVNVLAPGEDVAWIEVPEPSYPEDLEEGALSIEGVTGCVEDPCLMGFPANDIMVVANSQFLEENPAAAEVFQLIQIPLEDIFEQNARMNDGEDSQEDIERHAQEWIEENQDQWDQWIQQAIEAAQGA